MAAKVLIPGGVVTPTEVLSGAGVRVEDGRIAAVGQASELAAGGGEVLEAPGALLIPGLIDVHIHGGDGLHFQKEDGPGLDRLMRTLASWGVTGALPTLGAMLAADLEQAVTRLRALAGRSTGGARMLGIHLEGPYFNPRKKGAQYAEAIRLPDRAETERLLELAGGLVRLMTLAPEMEGADGVLAALREAGAIASAGHTEATYEDLLRTVPLGVRHATHTGNAMTGLHHREPGTLGGVLALDEINCELIGDGVHVHPAVMKSIWRAKGTERLILVSDATASAGLPDGEYHQGHRTVIIRDGKATLPDGTLAGSCSPLHRGVRNMVKLCGAQVHEAVRMASLNPARVAGCAEEAGSIETGKRADLVLVDDDFRPLLTMVAGEVVWQRS
jgi:N-acetylglucosamine-6-phosphate deacetylase